MKAGTKPISPPETAYSHQRFRDEKMIRKALADDSPAPTNIQECGPPSLQSHSRLRASAISATARASKSPAATTFNAKSALRDSSSLLTVLRIGSGMLVQEGGTTELAVEDGGIRKGRRCPDERRCGPLKPGSWRPNQSLRLVGRCPVASEVGAA
jgi:hypothetical protein